MIVIDSSGDFSKTIRALEKMSGNEIFKALQKFGRQGVAALSAATPRDSGETAASWSFEVTSSRGSHSIFWTNSNVVDGTPVVIMLQYGHGTGTGGYVSGRDFINPAAQPVMDKIANEVWKAVTSA